MIFSKLLITFDWVYIFYYYIYVRNLAIPNKKSQLFLLVNKIYVENSEKHIISES
mgnify:CR=1 FL=1